MILCLVAKIPRVEVFQDLAIVCLADVVTCSLMRYDLKVLDEGLVGDVK